MAEGKEKTENVAKSKQSKRSILRLLLILNFVLFLGIGGFFGWRLFMKGNTEQSKEKAQISESHFKNKKEETSVICPLDSFIVNLMDKAGLGKRYLKITVELEVGDEKHKNMIERHTTQLRDTILMLLSSRSFNDINTVEGKLGLKQDLLSKISQILGGGVVRRIYFTEFVVQ